MQQIYKLKMEIYSSLININIKNRNLIFFVVNLTENEYYLQVAQVTKINIYNKPVTIFNQILKTNIIQTR